MARWAKSQTRISGHLTRRFSHRCAKFKLSQGFRRVTKLKTTPKPSKALTFWQFTCFLLCFVIAGLLLILGLQPRDMAATLVVKTIKIISKNLHENGVYFPGERDAFVLDHQQQPPWRHVQTTDRTIARWRLFTTETRIGHLHDGVILLLWPGSFRGLLFCAN